MTIERPQPIVNQVNHILRQRIREGIYKPGLKMPSEGDLAAEFGISRTTLRTAMASLVSDGLILRKQGDGTYVNQHTFEVDTYLQNFWSYTNLIAQVGYEPVVHTLSAGLRLPSQEEATNLNLAPHDSVYALERLFAANARPAIYCLNVLPAHLLNGNADNFSPEKSIFDFLQQYCSQEIAYSTSDIRAVSLPEALASLLSQKPGTPILKFTDVFFNKNNQPIGLGLNYYDEKLLGMRLVRVRS